MPRKRKHKNSAERLENGLSDVSVGLGNQMTGGSYLSSYSTQAFSNNYGLLTLNRIILTYMYTGNGIFQTAIQLPIQDAIGKGIIIESGELDNSDIEQVYEFWEERKIWGKILDYMTWVRLFGGGALLINTDQDPQTPLNIKSLNGQPFALYDLDRWQMDSNSVTFDELETSEQYEDGNGIIYLYGEPIHESRFLIGKGKRAPHYVRRTLRGWGMSEGERMIRDLNLYMKAQDSTFELIDEAKVDVYKINGLAEKLMTNAGTSKVIERVQAANQIKNYVNALVLDDKEDHEQKVINFAGLAEVMNQNRKGVSAALRIPENKLFGQSSGGFSSGEDTLENYNQMIESDIRAELKPVVRQLLRVTMSHLFGYIPTFSFTFPPLRERTPEVEQNIKTQETNRILSFYDRGLLNSQEVMESARKAGVIQIETNAEKGLLPDQPEPPAPAETGTPFPASPISENSSEEKKKRSFSFLKGKD